MNSFCLGAKCKAIFYHDFKSTISHIHAHLPTLLLMSRRYWESWAYFYFMVCNVITTHKLVDFHDPVTLFLVSWFEKKNNLTLRRLQMRRETTKLIFDISKCICFFYSNLFYFFFVNNICTTFFKTILHKISQNYLYIAQATYKL